VYDDTITDKKDNEKNLDKELADLMCISKVIKETTIMNKILTGEIVGALQGSKSYIFYNLTIIYLL
jgi:hypothetical protein